jgi:hypothetical protein
MVDWQGDELVPARVLLAALLAFPLMIAIQSTAEHRGWPRHRQFVIAIAAALLLAGYALWSRTWSQTLVITRFAQLVVAFHLLAAVLPFVRTPVNRAFWQYNRILFIRFLIATLFAAVLFAGLAIALVAIDQLFGVDIDEEMYVRLWILIAFIFHPWYFLSGVPEDLDSLEQRTDYPTGIKVFAQFILIPVVSVYLLILTAYLVRVLVTRTWPSGWIGWLVSSVSAAGTLALLLVHPIREREDSRWVDAYGRWFFIAVLPSIAMLLMAIWQRVGQYGITERRYFLAVLALWLAAIALYYAVTASRNIRVIPTTLCIVALLIFVGPWSAYAVSERSQAHRLRDLLSSNEILADGRLQTPPADVPFADRREISAAVRYLINTHGARAFRYVAPELRQTAENPPPADSALSVDDPVARAVLDRVGIEYVNRWQSQPQPDFVNYFTDPYQLPVEVAGFETLVRVNLTQPFTVPVGQDTLTFTWVANPPAWNIALRAEPILSITLTELLSEARTMMEEPPERTPVRAGQLQRPPLVVNAQAGDLRIRALITNLNGQDRSGTLQIHSGEAIVLVGRGPSR